MNTLSIILLVWIACFVIMLAAYLIEDYTREQKERKYREQERKAWEQQKESRRLKCERNPELSKYTADEYVEKMEILSYLW